MNKMDNQNYGSSHLSSPALVVFSQAANGLSDALRIQRPFHSQMPDAKDLHHLSLVSGYGAHLLHGFQPHFLHPSVSNSGGGNTGPFGGGGAFVKPFPSNLPLPSAFAPPKCLGFGLDQGLLFGNESFRTDSSSPACASLSPPAKDESLEGGHTSEEGDRDRDRICSPTRSPETPGFRRIGPPKKTTFIGTPPPNSCPVCGIQLSQNDLETHFSAELGRIAKPSSYNERQELRRTLGVEMHVQNNFQGRNSRWETFHRIRNNRQSRLRGKLRKRKFDGEDGFQMQFNNMNCPSCPVCHGRLQRTQEEMAQHIEECVRKQNNQTMQEEDETVDVESYGDETSNGAINMTQSNINNNSNSNNNNNNNNINNNHNPMKLDQSIIKTTSVMDESTITSLSSVHQHWERKHRINLALNCTAVSDNSITRVTPTSSDQRIDVDYEGDPDHEQSQDMITDNDEEVIVDNTDDEDFMKKKKLMINRDDKNNAEEATSSVEIDSVTDSNIIRTTGTTPNSDSYVSTSETSEPASKAQVLEELKARIRELEGSPHYKCFICKERCKTLIISKICGHYLCNDCWIIESDTKKSCPRCKTITSSSDFRKIHV